MPPKIRLYKMFLLFVFTLGIYGIYWLARSRNRMVSKYKARIPHWLWLIVPGLVTAALILPMVLITYGATGKMEGTFLVFYGFALLTSLVNFAISLWWMYHYGKAAQRLTLGRAGLGWTMVYWIVFSPLVLFIFQYYYNRTPAPKSLPAKPKYKPTKKFTLVASIGLVVLVALNALAIVGLLKSSEFSKAQNQSQTVDAKFQETEMLLREYQACADQLETDYPSDELTEAQGAAYDARYEACDQIRIRQNTAVDEYNAAVQEL